jgi:hypothetical protein
MAVSFHARKDSMATPTIPDVRAPDEVEPEDADVLDVAEGFGVVVAAAVCAGLAAGAAAAGLGIGRTNVESGFQS